MRFINRKECFLETSGELKVCVRLWGEEERDLRGKGNSTLGSASGESVGSSRSFSIVGTVLEYED